MTWTDQKTWVTGEVWRARELNTYLRDDITDIRERHAARAARSTAQTITSQASEVFDTITFTDEVFFAYVDHEYIDLATHATRITIPENLGGYFLINAQIGYDQTGPGGTGGVRAASIRKNGTTVLARNLSPGSGLSGREVRVGVSTLANLAEGDYLELGAWQDSGASHDTEATVEATWLEVHRIGV